MRGKSAPRIGKQCNKAARREAGQRAGLRTPIGQGAAFPIDVLGGELGGVSLGGPDFPQHGVVEPPLRVVFGGEDSLVLGGGDVALGLDAQKGLELGNRHRPRQPTEAHGQVVQSPQAGRHACAGGLDYGQTLLTRHYAIAVQMLGQEVLTRVFRLMFRQLVDHLA